MSLRGAETQKSDIIILTATKTSNPSGSFLSPVFQHVYKLHIAENQPEQMSSLAGPVKLAQSVHWQRQGYDLL
jgi:hypothetical protein